MPIWRHILTPAAPGDWNMATDEALMARARRTGEWVFRVYAWSEPTLSFGRHQRVVPEYDPAALAAAGVATVRRPTGGRAILHHREVTYSVTAPCADAGALRTSYEAINRILLDGLRALGVPVALAAAPRVSAPGPAPCFDHPAPGELTVGDHKLVGSAQWRHDDALLQHGSILVEDDQPMVAALRRVAGEPPPPAATLREALGRAPSLEEVADALIAALRRAHPDASPLEPEQWLEDETERLRGTYRDPAWTWRR